MWDASISGATVPGAKYIKIYIAWLVAHSSISPVNQLANANGPNCNLSSMKRNGKSQRPIRTAQGTHINRMLPHTDHVVSQSKSFLYSLQQPTWNGTVNINDPSDSGPQRYHIHQFHKHEFGHPYHYDGATSFTYIRTGYITSLTLRNLLYSAARFQEELVYLYTTRHIYKVQDFRLK